MERARVTKRGSPTGKQAGFFSFRWVAPSITSAYVVFAAIWLVLWDRLLARLIPQNLEAAPVLATGLRDWVLVAVTAAILFVVLRFYSAKLGAHYPVTEPLPELPGPRLAVIRWTASVFALLAIAVGITGYITLSDYRGQVVVAATKEVSAVARVRADEMARWVVERRRDAREIAEDPFIAKSLSTPAGANPTSRLVVRLETMARVHNYRVIRLFDHRGEEWASAPQELRNQPLSPAARTLVRDALRDGDILVDRVPAPGNLQAVVGVAVPVAHRNAGAVYLELSADSYIVPLVRTWPVATSSGEILLIYRGAGNVRYAFEPLRKERPKTGPIPDSVLESVTGSEEVDSARRVDYRGREVFMSARPVSGTPWIVVAKQDVNEIERPLQVVTAWAITLVLVSIIAAAVVTALVWRNQEMRFLAAVYREKLEREALVRHFDYLAKYANDAILLMDSRFRIVEVNDRVLSLYGYTRQELLGKNASELRAPERLNEYATQWEKASTPAGGIFETRIRRKDGAIIPVEVSGRLIEVEGKPYLQSIVRDIRERKAAEAAQARFHAALETSVDATYLVDFETLRIVDVNRVACSRLGYAREELLGMTANALFSMLSLDDKASQYVALTQAPARAELREAIMQRKDGSEFPVEISRHVFEEDGRRFVFGIARDISERKAREAAIARLTRLRDVLATVNAMIVRVKRREELFSETCRIAVESGGFELAWIAVADPQTGEVSHAAWAAKDPEYFNHITAQRISTREHEPEGSGFIGLAFRTREMYYTNDIEGDRTYRGRELSLKRGFQSVMVVPIVVEGTTQAALALLSKERHTFDADERHLMTTLAMDVALALDRVEKQGRLEYLNYYDSVTGVHNRSALVEKLRHAIPSAAHAKTGMAIVSVDLHRFRDVNDAFGWSGGDLVLKEIGRRLQNSLPDFDLLARLQGNTFAVTLTDVSDVNQAVALVRGKILRPLSRPIVLRETNLSVTPRAGMAMFPEDGDSPEALLHRSELALKKAKAQGEALAVYSPALNDRVAERLSTEAKLRRAVDAKEFVLHYQAKVDLSNNAVSGAEALIRWQDPGGGLVPPGRFIPILEDTGMIGEVGEWIVKQLLADYVSLRKSHPKVPRLAFNVSAVQLRRPEFVAEIEAALASFSAESGICDIEITESLLMEDVQSNIDKLQLLRNLGIHLAVDDFGTGYSSLAYIARLPISALKIDKSFIDRVATHDADRNIAQTIIALAHSLNLKAIAEGVESESQVSILRKLGCDEAQGYYFSKPVPLTAFRQLIGA